MGFKDIPWTRIGLNVGTLGGYEIYRAIANRKPVTKTLPNSNLASTTRSLSPAQGNGTIHGSYSAGEGDLLIITLDRPYEFKVQGEKGMKRVLRRFAVGKGTVSKYIQGGSSKVQLPVDYLRSYLKRELSKGKGANGRGAASRLEESADEVDSSGLTDEDYRMEDPDKGLDTGLSGSGLDLAALDDKK